MKRGHHFIPNTPHNSPEIKEKYLSPFSKAIRRARSSGLNVPSQYMSHYREQYTPEELERKIDAFETLSKLNGNRDQGNKWLI